MIEPSEVWRHKIIADVTIALNSSERAEQLIVAVGRLLACEWPHHLAAHARSIVGPVTSKTYLKR
jgi:hypothetical protein